jgi:MGT family glycosyltransferase
VAYFAFIASPLPGHYNPLLVLAAELRARGHRTTFVHMGDAARLVEGSGSGFAAIGRAAYPPGSLDRWNAAMARLGGPLSLVRMIRGVAAMTDMIASEAPATLRALGVDAIVADQMEPAGGLVAEGMRLPFVTTATGLPINRERGVPPPYLGWRYDPSEAGARRNEGGYRVADLLMRPVGQVIERHSRALGIRVRRQTEDCFSPFAQLSQGVAAIDFPRAALEPGFHHLGPFRTADEEQFTLSQQDERPLVFCSLGSLQGARAAIFHKVAAACRDLGLRLVIAHGGKLGADAIAALPGTPMVYDFVPQRAVLKQAALAVSHAGFNTVLDALSFGVPLVTIPIAFEQPATAARLHHAGVAEVLKPGKLGGQGLHQAIEAVLREPRYRERAQAVAADIASAGGVRRAADLAEAYLG